MGSAIVKLLDSTVKLATNALKFKGDKDSIKYIVELAELRTEIDNERRRPMLDQRDTYIEERVDRIVAIADLAEMQKEGKNNEN